MDRKHAERKRKRTKQMNSETAQNTKRTKSVQRAPGRRRRSARKPTSKKPREASTNQPKFVFHSVNEDVAAYYRCYDAPSQASADSGSDVDELRQHLPSSPYLNHDLSLEVAAARSQRTPSEWCFKTETPSESCVGGVPRAMLADFACRTPSNTARFSRHGTLPPFPTHQETQEAERLRGTYEPVYCKMVTRRACSLIIACRCSV